MSQVRQIFEYARESKVYTSRRKLQWGKRVIFAGFEVLTKNGICTVRPDPTLSNAGKPKRHQGLSRLDRPGDIVQPGCFTINLNAPPTCEEELRLERN